jgi:hypothetical protein
MYSYETPQRIHDENRLWHERGGEESGSVQAAERRFACAVGNVWAIPPVVLDELLTSLGVSNDSKSDSR